MFLVETAKIQIPEDQDSCQAANRVDGSTVHRGGEFTTGNTVVVHAWDMPPYHSAPSRNRSAAASEERPLE